MEGGQISAMRDAEPKTSDKSMVLTEMPADSRSFSL